MSMHVDYDTVAAKYDNRYLRNDYAGVRRALTAFLPRQPQSRRAAVLEVGCGTGHWLKYLEHAEVDLVGIDLSARMLEMARAGVRAGQPALIQGCAEALPFRNGHFDRIVCINALHHFYDSDKFLRETRRVLRSGGAVLIVGLDPHAGEDEWWIYDYFPETVVQDQKRHASAAVIRERMRSAGFVRCQTRVVQRFRQDVAIDDAERLGALERTSTSQFMVISDDEYLAGLNRLRAASGTSLLRVDLRLYGTTGWAE